MAADFSSAGHSSSAVTREYYVEEELVMVDNRAVFDDIFGQGYK
jgi:hypothetical protein